MGFVYPDTFNEAKDIVEKHLNFGNIDFGFFGHDMKTNSVCTVASYDIKALSFDQPCWASMGLDLNLDIVGMDLGSSETVSHRSMSLVLFCAKGDITFPPVFRERIWQGYGKPHSIALDISNGDIYLVYFLKNIGLALIYFSTLPSVDVQIVLDGVNSETPYKFGVAQDALYNFIVQETGWKDLRRSLYIEFNTSHPISVSYMEYDLTDGSN